ncbi:octopamine receptor Oamb isoform X2 [Phymastichus coffea]|uniref:octopamine receptor Oamb isoform X2 n=1 Tax=Phymastichus coffea TaxID=108790 RepID=UPI00273CF12D|nr:octopamine receptor Oamb isoform X2 [Phymastichus coffea]
MMRKMNKTLCLEMGQSVYWGGAGNVTIFTILAFIDMIVIFGNILIIAAVYHSIKLRNVTNLFIVSLACADLMVGVAVLPFSATMEVLKVSSDIKVWIFGDIWCSMWLAVDVWMCTASILNLCAISLDRYLAVTRPIKYPTIMSPKRAKLLVAIVWVLSFIICFPPLVGQGPRTEDNSTAPISSDMESNSTQWFNNMTVHLMEEFMLCPWTCELTSDTSYVIYSALGSFYIPTLVMLFFYWRIYLAAASTTKAINRGFRTTKSTKSSGSQPDEQRLTLRIHRGRGTSDHNGSNGSPRESDSRSPSKRDRIKISVSYPSTETLNTKCNNSLERTPSKCSQVSVHYANGQTQSQLCPSSKSTHLKVGVAGSVGRAGSARRASRRSSCESQAAGDAVSLRESAPGSNEEKPRVMKMGKRNIKAQVKRIRMETKAAKTLGIIVGGFIMCWLPFFTVYVVQGFCGDCVNKVVFSVLFWLGYCNSAINPCIYALFSKEFRFAFKKIICNCFFKQRANTLRRGSDGSQLTTRFGFSGTTGDSRAAVVRGAVRRRAFRSKTPTASGPKPASSARRATPDDCSTSGSARSASP